MTNEEMFEVIKAELINSFKQYIATFEQFKTYHAFNANSLEQLSSVHHEAAFRISAFSTFMYTDSQRVQW